MKDNNIERHSHAVIVLAGMALRDLGYLAPLEGVTSVESHGGKRNGAGRKKKQSADE